ncbi:MAG TPA: L,D-transpeptidase family protein [Longimicrobiales bacterium]
MAAMMTLCAQPGFAQRSFTAVSMPTDSSNARKLMPPKGGAAAKPTKVAVAKPARSNFAHNQIENARVLAARTDKRFELKQLFRQRGLEYPAAEIFMRILKRERQLEMWVRPAAQDTFVLLKTYEICALNDKPGPKRARGDQQTPEGFYYIDNFNPRSDYHLSLRVNYPNASDAALGAGHTLGGDVFIHGGCKTAGCMAITDENIKEVYWLAVEARDHGQARIPVHIFPSRLSDNGLRLLGNVFKDEPDLVRFWSNLKRGYDYFEQTHKLPVVDINPRGRYVFNLQNKPGLLGKATSADSAGAPPQH